MLWTPGVDGFLSVTIAMVERAPDQSAPYTMIGWLRGRLRAEREAVLRSVDALRATLLLQLEHGHDDLLHELEAELRDMPMPPLSTKSAMKRSPTASECMSDMLIDLPDMPAFPAEASRSKALRQICEFQESSYRQAMRPSSTRSDSHRTSVVSAPGSRTPKSVQSQRTFPGLDDVEGVDGACDDHVFQVAWPSSTRSSTGKPSSTQSSTGKSIRLTTPGSRTTRSQSTSLSANVEEHSINDEASSATVNELAPESPVSGFACRTEEAHVAPSKAVKVRIAESIRDIPTPNRSSSCCSSRSHFASRRSERTVRAKPVLQRSELTSMSHSMQRSREAVLEAATAGALRGCAAAAGTGMISDSLRDGVDSASFVSPGAVYL